MADIRDVAHSAGVSIATVSRVFSGNASVAASTRDAVTAAADRLQYQPDAGARSLRTGRTMTIGLIVGDILNPFFTELARAVESEARRHGYLVIIGNSAEDPQLQRDYVRNLLERRVDGLILSPTRDPSDELITTLREHPAAVLVDRHLADLPCLDVDGSAAIDELVADLAAHGYRRPAIISGPTSISTGRARLEAFSAACSRHGLDLVAERVVEGDFQAASGRAGMRALLGADPDCVFIADNLMALGALDELAAAGLRFPDDIGLAVYDDVPWLSHTSAPMTAIAQPTAELGRRAVRTVLHRLGVAPDDGGSVAQEAATPLTASLIRRGSIGAGAPNSPPPPATRYLRFEPETS